MSLPQAQGNWHLSAYTVALGATADTDVPVISDDVLPITNGHIFPSESLKLFQAYFSGVTVLRARLATPKFRQYGYSYIEPVNAALLPPNLPPLADYWDDPFTLEKEEELAIQATDSAVGPNNAYGLVWLGKGTTPAPLGDTYTIRGVPTGTAVASAWTTLTTAFDINLPQGVYAVVGARMESTNGIAFRLIFENQFYRPGWIMSASSGLNAYYRELRRRTGVWGYFRTNSLPRIQVLCNAADTTFVMYLDVIRVGM